MIRDLSLRANGLDFHVLADGPDDGPLVLLLHGFPEMARSWRHQLPALAAAGYRAVAPDLRGYGRTDKRGPFDLDTLCADVVALVRALGRERAVIVGHDWGGAIAWAVASRYPEVVERLVVLNCPPMPALLRTILTNPAQALRSTYVAFFQIPRLPEHLLRRDGAVAIARALRGGSTVRAAWPSEETQLYRDAFLQPGAAEAALGYYRYAVRGGLGEDRRARRHPVRAPTLIVWGAEDRFLSQDTVSPGRLAPYLAPGLVPDRVLLSGAGHFVQNEAPGRVNEALLSWLGPAPGAE